MRVVIPYTPDDPKSRLGPPLDPDERAAFAACMLEDVVAAARDAGARPEVLSTGQLEDPPAPVHVDERSLSPAVDATLDPPMAVVMADLALLTPVAVRRALEAPGDVVLAPGRGGGTNALVVRDEAFSVDFHGVSIADHREIAAEAGLEVTEVDSYRLSTDIDEPEDLVEVLLHGGGRAADWLRGAGFRPVATDGRVTVARG